MARLIELKQTAPERFLARFDTGEELRTTLAVVTDYHLSCGKELTEAELDTLRAASERSRCRQRALRIIGARAMSVKELTDRLKEKGESPENAEDAAAWLQEMHLLDDAQYAAMCVRHYAAKGYGAGRIRSELYRRGIPRELWDDALALLPEGCVRVLVTAGLATIKERFAARMHGNLPAPVAAMLERKYGRFETETHDLRVDTDAVSAEEAANEIRLLLNRGERDAQN